MQGLVILRHNDAVRMVAKALGMSPHLGDGLLWMDAGKAHHVGSLGTRIPAWVLPKLTDNDRNKMRPDIMFMKGAMDAWKERTEPLSDKTGITVHLIELGYGPDTRYEDKKAAKLQQHQALITALQAEKWTVIVHTLIIGVGGSVFDDLRQFLDVTLGLSTPAQTKIVRKIIRITAERAHQLLQTRRWLERTGPSTSSGLRPQDKPDRGPGG